MLSKKAPLTAAVSNTAVKPRKRTPELVRVRIKVEVFNPKTGERTVRHAGSVNLRLAEVRTLVERVRDAAGQLAGIVVVSGPDPDER